ncbi:uncharacterized protein LOC134730639 isoform X2 [Pan paniscus]|uniref:uncharacterized protein LOC134730639 isoform X2 n=1 Tax=Pan paniscus TaxID=9597 RepID=UPI00300753A8
MAAPRSAEPRATLTPSPAGSHSPSSLSGTALCDKQGTMSRPGASTRERKTEKAVLESHKPHTTFCCRERFSWCGASASVIEAVLVISIVEAASVVSVVEAASVVSVMEAASVVSVMEAASVVSIVEAASVVSVMEAASVVSVLEAASVVSIVEAASVVSVVEARKRGLQR